MQYVSSKSHWEAGLVQHQGMLIVKIEKNETLGMARTDAAEMVDHVGGEPEGFHGQQYACSCEWKTIRIRS